MNKLNELMAKAQASSFYLWLLNRLLHRMVPFNAPHGLQVVQVGQDKLAVALPYRRANLNHIKGIHACALATLCEYVCGLLLMHRLGAAKYRIIMQKMQMEYVYQAKTDVKVEFGMADDWLQKHIIQPLLSADSTVVDLHVQVKDLAGKEICRGIISWQIKSWEKVKTKL